jgi:hypothetical protein
MMFYKSWKFVLCVVALVPGLLAVTPSSGGGYHSGGGGSSSGGGHNPVYHPGGGGYSYGGGGGVTVWNTKFTPYGSLTDCILDSPSDSFTWEHSGISPRSGPCGAANLVLMHFRN